MGFDTQLAIDLLKQLRELTSDEDGAQRASPGVRCGCRHATDSMESLLSARSRFRLLRVTVREKVFDML